MPKVNKKQPSQGSNLGPHDPKAVFNMTSLWLGIFGVEANTKTAFFIEPHPSAF